MPGPSLETSLATALALIEQYSAGLSSPDNQESPQSTGPSPLPLIAASALTLKAQTTKLSLLAINTPFTPSAISTVLVPINESVIPSLITGTQLTTSKGFTETLSSELRTHVKDALKDFKVLIEAIIKRSKSSSDLKEGEKKFITESTGKIWEDCDSLGELASGGIAGIVIKKAQQYKALIEDAIKELEEWDPDEDDDPFGDIGSDGEDGDEADHSADESEATREQKTETLKVFQRVPQCIHVIVKSRLQKEFPPSPTLKQLENLDRLVTSLETASEAVDDAAGAFYDHDLFSAKVFTDKVKARTTEAVDCVLQPWNLDTEEATKEDRYIQRARDWIQAVGRENRSVEKG